jgi:hypothetical protein
VVRRLCLLLSLLLAAPAFAQSICGSAYAVGGIAVDVRAGTAGAARLAAWRIAQRKAWPLLWSRLTGGAVTAAPRLSDGQLDGIVAGIESQGERFSTNRYIARLGVIFDRSRTSDWLGGAVGRLQSPPMLLLPVLVEAGAATVYQARTPWRAAWQRHAENVTPIEYVLASGTAGDNLVLTGWQTQRPDRPTWRDILARFDAVDVLIAEARLTRGWPGGPVQALIIARHGPDASELGRFTLRTSDEEGLDAMFDQAVAKIDEIFAAALRDGRLRAAPDLALALPEMNEIGLLDPALLGSGEGSGGAGSMEAPVASFEIDAVTADAATAAAIETVLRGTPGMASVTVTSLAVAGTSRLLVGYAGTASELALALDARGWRLAGTGGPLQSGTAGPLQLRRRRAGEAPLARPVAAAPAAAAPALPAPPPPNPALPLLPPAPPAPVSTAPVSTTVPRPTTAAPAEPPRRPREPAAARKPPERAAPVDLLPPQGR